MYPFISIIIPTVRPAEILDQCVESLLKQDYPSDRFEIILLPDQKLKIAEGERIKIIYGFEYVHKRNEGSKIARGELLAFVDDDCVMPSDWMSKAVPYFKDRTVAVVGGPALPLLQDTLSHRIGGYLLGSPFASGFASSRYKVLSKAYEAKEYSLLTANNFLRKDMFDSVSGFDAKQVLAEENDLYFRLKERGYKLLYVPEIFVWHRARPIFLPLIKKVFFYATGRGMLLLRKPRTFRIIYLIPTLFVGSIVGLPILSFFFPLFFFVLLAAVLLYGGLNFLNALFIFFERERHLSVPLLVFVSTPLIHCSYGIGVLYGMYLYLSGGTHKGRMENTHKNLPF